MELRTEALRVLRITDPGDKAQQARQLWAAPPAVDAQACLHCETPLPGRPERPHLVPANQVPGRSPFTLEGRTALIHALCHIEFNAINLALDAVWRFPGMPEAFYTDWLQVAGEEGHHFQLLRDHLQSLGADYGDFDGHDGLWQMAERTAHDVLARMALVPRTMEARGLDATPPLQAKFAKAGDARAVAILDIILREEVGHVAIGNRWFRWLCQQTGQDPHTLYPALVVEHEAPRMRRPFNMAARRAAGFDEDELRALESMSPPPCPPSAP
jgi:uncharacterized ferritin-like protein (DUF455 family)